MGDRAKLCVMYVDRKLAGLHALQTLSRLNRVGSGKKTTFVLDFQNTIEDIQEAFRPNYEVASVETAQDQNQIYELESRLMTFGYPDRQEIEITDDMLSLRKFRIDERERGKASLSPGDNEALTAIEEFGARPYTEDERKELSEIVRDADMPYDLAI